VGLSSEDERLATNFGVTFGQFPQSVCVRMGASYLSSVIIQDPNVIGSACIKKLEELCRTKVIP
jgi:hypothetical protein